MSAEDLVQATVQPVASEGAVSEPWMPIETAPKDGDVLCFVPGFGMGMMVLYWMDGYWREKANSMGLKRPPTHWMPLPAAPGSDDRTNATPDLQRQNETDYLLLQVSALVAEVERIASDCDAVANNFRKGWRNEPVTLAAMFDRVTRELRAALTASKDTGERS
jgi:hypothetical protein